MPGSYRPRRPDSRRRTISVILALAVLLVGLIALQWLQSHRGSLPVSLNLAVLDGEIALTRADTRGVAVLHPNETVALQRGDEVRTGPGARARLTFGGGETVELGAETRLILLELSQDATTRALVAVLALNQGQTLTRIRHMLLPGTRFEIQTPVITLQAHGTLFQCDVLAQDQAYVAVFEGSVSVSMGQQVLELQAGQGVRAQLGQPLTAIAVAQPTPATTVAAVVASAVPPTLTNAEKTLFPPVLTPTRPGDRPAPAEGESLYTVQKGDTLYSIARKFGVSWEAIWEVNKDTLSKPDLLRVGQELRIPKP